ncbi:MAG TPA: periplasmic heavy metal sensor [Bacteroidota bacterium]|nr:periplasmic heavy metal sensor [Bacteroidota bacterium]
MDIFAQKKFMTWTIALLVLLNLISMTALWYQHLERPPQQGTRADQRQESVTEFLNRELQLDDNQKVEFERLRREYVDSSSSLTEDMRSAKKALFELVGEPSPDRTAIENLAKNIGAKQAALDLLLFNHLSRLRTLCTPAQKEKFNTIFREIRDLMRPQNAVGERRPPQNDDGRKPRGQQGDDTKPRRDPNKPPRQPQDAPQNPRPPRD